LVAADSGVARRPEESFAVEVGGMVQWVIQDGRYAEYAAVQRLVFAVAETGEPLRYVQHTHGEPLILDPLPTDQPVVFFGSIATIQEVQRLGLPVTPLCWFDQTAMRCSGYYARYGSMLLQRYYAFYPFAEVGRLRDWLYEVFGDEDKLFIRPDENNKSFSGQVVSLQGFKGWWDTHADKQAPDALCVVARPEALHGEWRFVVADGRVVGGSQYRDEGESEVRPVYPAAAAAFAEKVAATWSPHPIFCVDIARTAAGDLRLVEIGSINCSGFYECDPRPVVQAINRIAEREWQQTRAH
jgi:hypothetical protein